MATATSNGKLNIITPGAMTTTDPRLRGQRAQRVDPFVEIGTTGLRQYGGFILEEWLTKLSGRRGAWVYREMLDNSSVVGSIMFSIRMLARQVEWKVEGSTEKVRNGMLATEYVDSCMHDMSHTWGDFVSEAMSFLGYGWALHEEVFKRRQGEQPEPPWSGTPATEEDNSPASSKYIDGLIGWRKLPIRAQETLMRWDFDGYAGLRGMEQVDWHGGAHTIPIAKSLLFRTEASRGNPEGRALALNTPIPTPDGWKTMADLEVGSRVFDEAGRVRYVTAVADWTDRPCHEMTFSDGSTIIADENHEWATQKVWERSTGIAPRLHTTAEIADSTHNSNGVSNHGIAWAGALDYAEQHLAIDPYLLGLWLGDGNARSARITCHADDVEEQAVLIGAAGYETSIAVNGQPEGNGRMIDVRGAKRWTESPQGGLRNLGVLENKHIPAHYLRGSADQRLALLQGLMDSDGHADVKGRCEFVNTNRNLVDGVAELVRSLGVGCRVALRHRAGEYRHTWDAYSVKFTPPFAPFRLERKAARCGKSHGRPFHYITRCERVENRATRCIEVDGPSHLYLAGKSMVPTHNSILRNAYESFFYMKNIQTDEAIGISRDLTGIPKLAPPDGVDLYSPQNKELLQRAQDLVSSIEKDEQQGIVLPTSGWILELMKTGGSRQVDTDEVIRRYRQEIASSVLADFILVGLDNLGSYAMVDVKAELFGVAVDAVLDIFCETMNRYAIPRLFRLNGFQINEMPRITHSSAGRLDLEKVGNFLYHLAGAGAQIPWSDELIEQLFGQAGMPAKFAGEAVENVHKADEPDPKGLVSVTPQLADRARVLSMALEHDMGSALVRLGQEASSAYLTIAQKAAKPNARQLAGKVMRALDVRGWIARTLMPLLKNHAGRVAGDTQRVLQQEVGQETRVASEDVERMEANAGQHLRAADIEPQVRDAIMRAIDEGLKAGDNPTRTAQRIKDMVPPGRFTHAGSQYRSQLIARNETADAQRSAILAAYEGNPHITAVRVRDGIYGPPRSDETCMARDGDVVPIGEVAKVMPYHPLCTLSFDPVVEPAAQPVAV